MHSNSLVVIAGPTGIGKTDLAIQLATIFQTEIISADSRQFYRELEIGTARPSPSQLKEAKHHFTGFLSIHDPYNAGMFESDVMKLLPGLFKKNNCVILCGGSGLYIDAVCRGFDRLPVADEETRKQLNALLEKEGISALQKILEDKDPEYFRAADIQNPRRLMRAIEVCILSGKPYSQLLKQKKSPRLFGVIPIGLNTSREILYAKINKRVDQMMKSGLREEAEKMHPFCHLNALHTVGYPELFDFFEKKISLEEAVDRIRQNTRKFAKRQLTWFRKNKEMTWFEPDDLQGILTHLTKKRLNPLH